jgi:IS4 transposase
VKRVRDVDIVALFWTVVLGFGTGAERTIAGLRRAYQAATGRGLVPSSFYDRFNAGFASMLRRVCREAMSTCEEASEALRGALSSFADVVLTDSTVVRLHDLLAKSFPACRTNHTVAALKLHVVMSVAGRGMRSVQITSERVHDGPMFRVGRWVKDRLLLFDLGYYRFQLFDCIRRNGGYFISRLKTNANPVIVGENRCWRGQAVPLVGRKLQEVLGQLQRESLDVEVELSFQRRRYAGKRSSACGRFRLVGVRDEHSREYHLFITNVPVETLDAVAVARTYAARWAVELLFKRLKSDYRLDELPSSKKHVVECLLYAALLTMIASRALHDAVRAKLGAQARRVRDARWAVVFAAVASDILLLVVQPPRKTATARVLLERVLLREAVDPNVRRQSLQERIENGTHRYQHSKPVRKAA